MVTRLGAYTLMNLVMDLVYVYERCRSVTLTPIQNVQVKGDTFILDVLTRQRGPMSEVVRQYPALRGVESGLTDWIAYLDKRYVPKLAIFGPPFYLERPDAKRLAEDVEQWRASILNVYKDEGTVFINASTLDSVFPQVAWSQLDDMTRQDLQDAVSCVLHLLPTPGAMISFRAAESIIRGYYERVTGRSASARHWGQLLEEMQQEQIMKPSALAYARFLKDKRNEAEHPDKRFTQEESERILLHIKSLLEELKT